MFILIHSLLPFFTQSKLLSGSPLGVRNHLLPLPCQVHLTIITIPQGILQSFVLSLYHDHNFVNSPFTNSFQITQIDKHLLPDVPDWCTKTSRTTIHGIPFLFPTNTMRKNETKLSTSIHDRYPLCL